MHILHLLLGILTITMLANHFHCSLILFKRKVLVLLLDGTNSGVHVHLVDHYLEVYTLFVLVALCKHTLVLS